MSRHLFQTVLMLKSYGQKTPKKMLVSVRSFVARKSKRGKTSTELAEILPHRFSGLENLIFKSDFQNSKIFDELGLKNRVFKPKSLTLTVYNFFVCSETDFDNKGWILSWIKSYRLVYTLFMLFSSPEGLQSGKNFKSHFCVIVEWVRGLPQNQWS